MTKYIDQELARYWPVSRELMAEYRDGDKPARIYADGNLIWLKNGLYHRDGDKPAYIGANGTLSWFQNDLWYRDGDKPARIITDGCLEWWQNGQQHRLRGPAVINPDGETLWWINHKNITDEVNEWLAGEEWYGTPEQIFEFKLRFA